MSSYVNPQKTKKVELNDKEWIELRAELSVKEIIPFSKIGSAENMDFEQVIELISALIVNWSIQDSDGNEIPFDKEKVGNLSIEAFVKLQGALTDIIKLNHEVEKKN